MVKVISTTITKTKKQKNKKSGTLAVSVRRSASDGRNNVQEEESPQRHRGVESNPLPEKVVLQPFRGVFESKRLCKQQYAGNDNDRDKTTGTAVENDR